MVCPPESVLFSKDRFCDTYEENDIYDPRFYEQSQYAVHSEAQFECGFVLAVLCGEHPDLFAEHPIPKKPYE